MYLVTLPQNKLEQDGRVAGWHRVPLARDGKRTLRDLCSTLKDKGISTVYGSDLDSDAVRLVANELHSDYREEFRYRRFNVGRNHAAKSNHVTMLVESKVQAWKDNPIVPMHGGDSWASLQKRLHLMMGLAEKQDAVFVTDAQTATLIVYGTPQALLMNGTGLRPGKVYKVDKVNAVTQ